VLGVIAGLGGRDIRVADVKEILQQAHRGELGAPVTWWNVLQPEEEAVAAEMAK
jgi:hypothetical protein